MDNWANIMCSEKCFEDYSFLRYKIHQEFNGMFEDWIAYVTYIFYSDCTTQISVPFSWSVRDHIVNNMLTSNLLKLEI
jgi:hypothetical protein